MNNANEAGGGRMSGFLGVFGADAVLSGQFWGMNGWVQAGYPWNGAPFFIIPKQMIVG